MALFEQQAQIKTGLLINWLKSNLVLMQKQSLFLDILSEIPISILSPKSHDGLIHITSVFVGSGLKNIGGAECELQ